jgi:hydroxyquinol 1,2-dioxygenase
MTSTSQLTERPREITAQVLTSFEGAPDPRLREVMRSLVTHLHGFVTDVGLTEDEWAAAIAVLTATGDITDEQRQEFILWSDTLGVSMLVDALAHPTPSGATESTVLGPFYAPGSPLRESGATIAEQDAGVPAWVHGRVLGLDGAPIVGAELDVWQNGSNRLYAVQDDGAPEHHLRGRFRTDREGRYSFQAVRPVPYPIPDDGPVGQMLEATARHPWRPAHIHIVVRAPGFQSLTTHIFDAESEYLDRDTVFAVKSSLLRTFQPRRSGDPGTPGDVAGEWVSLELDLVLAPGDAGPNVVVDRGRTH